MTFIQNELWNNKAVGFVTRARQELWGKHNAEIMAFLFERGLSHKTAEKLLLGWNRRGKLRSGERWGLEPEEITSKEGKMLFAEGIVVPFVLEEQLRKVTIVSGKSDPADDKNHIVEGSQPISMVYGEKGSELNTIVADNILDGFYVSQELGENDKNSLIIPHDFSELPDAFAEAQLVKSKKVTFLTRQGKNACEKWAARCNCSTIKTYSSREELASIIK